MVIMIDNGDNEMYGYNHNGDDNSDNDCFTNV